jgi:hypothetical protein
VKYHIDTIPVWDALRLNGECMLCSLRRKQELLSAERYLGGSVMEPDVRIAVNKAGFCQRHQALLYTQSNRLGHALMMHTHLKETHDRLRPLLDKAESAARGKRRVSAGMHRSRSQANSQLQEAARQMEQLINQCALCEGLDTAMGAYTHTLLYMYKTDPDFKRAFECSKGVCLKDASALMMMAEEVLSGNTLSDFVCALSRLTHENLERAEGEVEWFTLKADYRNADKPWGTSRDALERTVNRLRGWCIGAEPNLRDH